MDSHFNWPRGFGRLAIARRYDFRTVGYGVETLTWPRSATRHRHRDGYADVVLAGSFTEVGFGGRHYAEPGDVLLHGRFDCHLNRHRSNGSVQLLSLPWHEDAIEGHFRVKDPDFLARLAEADPYLAGQQLAHALRPAPQGAEYWVDELAAALSGGFNLPLADWASRHGLRPETVSRAFHGEFGVSAKRFRLEVRTRLAWRAVLASSRPLTEIAMEFGFSDLAHMSRSIRVFTGRPPSRWRGRSSLP